MNETPRAPLRTQCFDSNRHKLVRRSEGGILGNLLCSAAPAADPAPAAEFCTCEGARVSGQVASQRRQRPLDQGTIVAPNEIIGSPQAKAVWNISGPAFTMPPLDEAALLGSPIQTLGSPIQTGKGVDLALVSKREDLRTSDVLLDDK